ncbi:MAG: hypothetical protein WCK11_05900 [Candidatus Falkowbacteria bacterium]
MNLGGVWPVPAVKPDGTVLYGLAFLAPKRVKLPSGQVVHELPLNRLGEILLQVTFEHSLAELEGSKMVLSNRDGGYAYRLLGGPIYDLPRENDKKYEPIPYDSEKFDEKKEYRQKFADRFGTSLSQVSAFWREYYRLQALRSEEHIYEVTVGSAGWYSYRSQIEDAFPWEYKTPLGELRLGWLPTEVFADLASDLAGFNGFERYAKRAGIPLNLAASFTGIGAIMAASAVVGDAVAAGIDDSWTGLYARAKCLRQDFAPVMRQVVYSYQAHIRRLLNEQRQNATSNQAKR